MARSEDTSKNIWIKEDDPVQASRLSRHKDDYEDIAQERRQTSDFCFATKSRELPEYKYHVPRSLEELRKHVLASDRVRYTVEQVSANEKLPLEQVQQSAKQILQEMTHNLNLTSIRSFAFFLIKVIKKLYQRVYVNEEGIEKLRSLVHEYPVILMPTHRSYADFLILSYVCFHYDLPLPVIAAAMDFMSMKFFGSLLRNCGAFFIRRTFGMDRLYWAVFTEFVQTHIQNADNPVEFFVEGTRSRTGKSYLPKQGMLSVVLEPYFKACCPDVMIVPVSMSYDRVLEESLYAYEQLGIPKPKESTSGLLKARSILQEDFGNIHLHFGEAISVRQYAEGKIDRVIHSLAPRYVYGLTVSEQNLCGDLAYDITLQHQQLMVISPWALIASVLMQNKDGIHVRSLTQEVEWLKRCTENLGGYIDWEGSEPAETIVRKQLRFHQNIVTVTDDDFVTIKLVKPGHVTVQNDVILNGATHIMLSLYRNHVIHCFSRVAIISTVINATSKERISIDNLRKKYEFLENVLSKDFIYKPGTSQQSFAESLKLLINCGEVSVESEDILVKKSVNKYSLFFTQMFEPFLLAYWVLCQYLLCSMVELNGRPTAKRYDHVTREVQTLIVRLLQENVVKHYEMLSLILLSNGLAALTDMGAIRREKREKTIYVFVNPVEMTKLTEQLAEYVDAPAIPLSDFAVQGSTNLLQAKL